MDIIDTETLITLIESRPALWDKTDESYKNKHSHFAAWMKICNALNDDFHTLSHKDKNEFRKGVVKKWNNARDNWMKCHRRLVNGTEPGVNNRKYKYYDKMSFLSKVVKRTSRCIDSRPVECVTEVEPDTNEEILQTDEDTTPIIEVTRKKDRKRKRKQANEEQEQIVSLINNIENEDKSRIMCFFKSIAPTVDNFTDEDIVEFQYEVIKVMRTISRRNQGPHYVYLPNS